MNCDTICKAVGELARPLSIIILAAGIVGGMFAGVDGGLATIASTCFLALIGARATENIFQTKATVETQKSVVQGATATAAIAATASTEDKKTAAAAATEDKKTDAINPQGVKP